MKKNEKGVFLVSSLLVLSVIGTFSVALFTKNITLYRSSERTANRIAAFHLAESGVDRAIVQLRSDLSYAGQSYTALGSKGGYQILVESPDPVASPRLRRITATGHTPSNAATAPAYASRQVVAYVNFSPPSPFNQAIFSDLNIQMTGNSLTNSYDSRIGPYDSATANWYGDIGTNGTAAGSITLSGNARVHGYAEVGPGADVSTAISQSGNTNITGVPPRRVASALVVNDPVQIPSELTNQGSLSASGNNKLTLPGGTYWYSSVNVTGNGEVSFTGPVTLYVSGAVTISGNGEITSGELPPNLIIKVQGSSPVTLSGNGEVLGGIYAPQSTVDMSGNADLYGAVVSKSSKLSGNAHLHHDEALHEVAGGSGTQTAQVRAWTET